MHSQHQRFFQENNIPAARVYLQDLYVPTAVLRHHQYSQLECQYARHIAQLSNVQPLPICRDSDLLFLGQLVAVVRGNHCETQQNIEYPGVWECTHRIHYTVHDGPL